MHDMIGLIEPLIPALRRYARGMLRDQAAADDLVQDTLERAISRWHQRRPDGNVRTWIFTILHRLAINRIKQKARRGLFMLASGDGGADHAQPPLQESRLHRADIIDAVGRLPEDQRAVLLLISVEDLSYAEAADALEIPIGTVMSRLSRARDRLRLELGDESRPPRPYLRSIK